MMSLNIMIVVGNLASEPVMRLASYGQPITSFNIATNWRYTTSEGQRKEETEWFLVVTRGKLAAQCSQSLAKGRLVYLEGRLRSRLWDGNDQQKHFRNEIIATKVSRLEQPNEIAALPVVKSAEASLAEGELGDIPF